MYGVPGDPEWDYHVEYINAYARAPQVKDFLATYYPGTKFSKYAVESTLPRLNQLGERGWELVQMQPVFLQRDGTVTTSTGPGTNTYFCVFKRLKRPSY